MPVYTLEILATARDGESQTGTWVDSGAFNSAYDDAVDRFAPGWSFQLGAGQSIPQGATINSCFFRAFEDRANSGGLGAAGTIRFQDNTGAPTTPWGAGNAPNYSGVTYIINNAGSQWTRLGADGWHFGDGDTDELDRTADMQALVNARGWTTGDYFNVAGHVTTQSGANFSAFYDYGAGPTVRAQLIIDFVDAPLEQEGHRWRDDDGDEDAATWLAAQDVANVFRAIGANTRLRALINATGDPASLQFRLEYALQGSGNWAPVMTTQPSETPATVVAVAAPTQANPTTTFDIVVPAGVQGGDLLEVTFISRDHTSGTAQPTVDDNESGNPAWTQAGFSTNRQVHIFYRRATGALGAASATIGSTITVAGCVGSSCGGLKVIRGALGSGDPYTNIVFEENASGNEVHAAFTPSNPNSMVGFIVGNATNDTLPVTVMAAATLGTFEPEDFSDLSTGGADCYIISSARPQAGAAADTGQFTWTQTNSATISCTYAIRPAVPAVLPILMAASASIAASGEATTAQLTAPAGKSTSDFVAGRIQDDENPADAVDITTDDYTELEWCLEATAGATDGEVYEFRVTAGGTPLQTYSTTPTLTVGSAGAFPPLPYAPITSPQLNTLLRM